MGIVESWLSDSIANSELLMHGFSFHRLDRCSRGGGLVVLVKNKYHSTCENSFISEDIEIIHVAVEHDHMKPIQIICFYRPPSGNTKKAIHELSNILNNIDYFNLPTILMGDINIDMLNFGNNNRKIFLEAMSTYGLQILNKKGTRSSLNSSSLIDVILVNRVAQALCGKVSNCPVSYSDHDALVFPFKKQRIGSHNPPVKIKLMDINPKTSFDVIHKLNEIPFTDLQFDQYIDVIQDISKAIPLKEITVLKKQSNNTWMTPELFRMIEFRENVYKLYKKHGCPHLLKKYKYMKSICHYKIKSTKRNYFTHALNNAGKDPKKYWKVLSPILGKSVSEETHRIIYEKRHISQPLEISNAFANFFTNVVSTLKAGYVPTCFPQYPRPLSVAFAFKHCDAKDVEKIYNRIHRAPIGTMGIPKVFLRLNRCHFIKSLVFYINRSFDMGVFPSSLKKSVVRPIFKKGCKYHIENYRPVSHLPNVSVFFEEVVRSQISSFFNLTKSIFEEQHGFRPNFSTKTACVSLVNNLLCSYDRGYVSCVAFLDLSKAFDTIDHNILLNKLFIQHNFSAIAVKWISSYLENRYQYVEYGNEKSCTHPLKYGVPQGSILGPLLFNIYVNDIGLINVEGKIYMYADDIALVISSHSLKATEDKMNRAIDKISNYFKINGLVVNTEKSKYMFFGHSRTQYRPQIFYNDTLLEHVNVFKYLGYTIDCKLNFSNETNTVISKLNKCAAIISRSRSFLDTDVLLKILNCLALSYINYAHTFITYTNKSSLNKLVRCYNNLGCTIYHCSTHCLHLFNWIPLDNRLLLANLTFIHRIIYNNCCPSLKYVFATRSRPYNTRLKNTFEHIRCNKKVTEGAFQYWAPRLWDNMDEDLKNSSNQRTFSMKLKHKLLK